MEIDNREENGVCELLSLQIPPHLAVNFGTESRLSFDGGRLKIIVIMTRIDKSLDEVN